MKKLMFFLAFSLSFLQANYYEHFIKQQLDDSRIRIEDGSIWEIAPTDRSKISQFFDVPLSFRTDESWLSQEVICSFMNKNSGQKIVATLILPPDSYAQQSHWIAYLEPKKAILFLDNGSIFSLYNNDREYFKNWRVDDFIIAGDYYSWLSQTKHILFNYRTKEFIFGELQ
jgi:hypothetical protein